MQCAQTSPIRIAFAFVFLFVFLEQSERGATTRRYLRNASQVGVFGENPDPDLALAILGAPGHCTWPRTLLFATAFDSKAIATCTCCNDTAAVVGVNTNYLRYNRGLIRPEPENEKNQVKTWKATAVINVFPNKQDIRATEVDKAEVAKSLRPGDIIRARVISLGDSTQYFLSTAENELGVRWAKSAAGAIMIPISWQVRERERKTFRFLSR